MLVQIWECIFFCQLTQVLSELCHFNDHLVRFMSWQSSKPPCCARNLTAPFPLSMTEIWEVRQILPAPPNKDLVREITRVRNHISILWIIMAHCPSWHQKNKLFWTCLYLFFEYCVQFWSCFLVKSIKELEKIQKRAKGMNEFRE